MQTAGIFVSALPEFSAGMQVSQHQLDRRHFPFRMDVDRNPASVVANRNTAVDVNVYIDLVAKSGEMFVDRIVENFEYHVVQTALVRVADVHSGALPDGF